MKSISRIERHSRRLAVEQLEDRRMLASGEGGPVIISGDGLPGQGSAIHPGEDVILREGWSYVGSALDNVVKNVTRAGNDGSIAVLGASHTKEVTRDAGGAYHWVSQALDIDATFYEGEAAIIAFFADLAYGAVNPAVIVSTGPSFPNGMDETEGAAIAANSQDIADFVNSGGGFISHRSASSNWLTEFFPNLTAGTNCTSIREELTPAGRDFFPGLGNDAFFRSNCPSYFRNHGLPVLAQYPIGNPQQRPGTDVTVQESEPNELMLEVLPGTGVTVVETEPNDWPLSPGPASGIQVDESEPNNQPLGEMPASGISIDEVEPNEYPVTALPGTGVTVNEVEPVGPRPFGAREHGPNGSFSIGDDVLGEINFPGDVDSFTFTGAAGQTIVVSPGPGTIGLHRFDLYDSSNRLLRRIRTADVDQGDYTIPVDGTYTIEIHTQLSDDAGFYTIEVRDGVSTNHIAIGDNLVGEISAFRGFDIVTFDAVQDQIVVPIAVPTGGQDAASMWVFHPNRTTEFFAVSSTVGNSLDLPFVAPVTGTYLIEIRVGEPRDGSYRFELREGAPSDPIAIGDDYLGITPQFDFSDYFSFETIAGEPFMVTYQSGDVPDHSLDLYGGMRAGLVAVGENVFWHIPRFTGTYYMKVDPQGEGNYSVELRSAAPATTINIGDDFAGSIDNDSTSDFFAFEAALDDVVQLEAIGDTLSSGQVRIYGTDAKTVVSEFNLGTSRIYKVPEGGRHYVEVDGSGLGSYTVKLRAVAPVIDNVMAIGDDFTGHLADGTTSDVVSFFGTAGQQIRINAVDSHVDRVMLIAPDGVTEVGRLNSGLVFEVLPYTGNYFIELIDFGGTDYRISLREADVELREVILGGPMIRLAGQEDPDLVSTALTVAPYHALLGQTSVSLTISNQGGDAGPFDYDLIWSDDEIVGNDDDVVIETRSQAEGLAGDTSVDHRHQ